MVVDGSEVSRTIISRIIKAEMKNTHIVTCGSGEEALAHLGLERFDLITTSLMWPDMDGLALAFRPCVHDGGRGHAGTQGEPSTQGLPQTHDVR